MASIQRMRFAMTSNHPRRWVSSLRYLAGAATLTLLVGCSSDATTTQREAGNTNVYTVDEMKSNDNVDKTRDSAS